MTGQKLTLDLFCEFTKPELEQAGQELSAALINQREIVEEKADAMRKFKDRLDLVGQLISKWMMAVRKKGEIRPVECEVEYHVPTKGVKTIVRLDTGEVVKECAMTDSELQQRMFPGEVAP